MRTKIDFGTSWKSSTEEAKGTIFREPDFRKEKKNDDDDDVNSTADRVQESIFRRGDTRLGGRKEAKKISAIALFARLPGSLLCLCRRSRPPLHLSRSPSAPPVRGPFAPPLRELNFLRSFNFLLFSHSYPFTTPYPRFSGAKMKKISGNRISRTPCRKLVAQSGRAASIRYGQFFCNEISFLVIASSRK